jgi:hypothetical protein
MKTIFARLITTMAGLTTLIPSALASCADPVDNEEKLNCLFPTQEELIGNARQNEGTTSLSTGDLGEDFIPFFINSGLSIGGTLIFISFLYAGYLLVFTNDSEENIEKGKKIMIYSIIGATVMAISYAIVFGIANLQIN